MKIIMLAAVSTNNVLGFEGDLPWRSPRDMAMFKEITSRAEKDTVNTLVMGRKTYESIGIPLPGRHTCVLTRGDWIPALTSNNVTVCNTIEEVNRVATINRGALFVCGGGDIYSLYFPICDEVMLTRFDVTVDPYDTVFPIDLLHGFHTSMGELYEADDDEPYAMTVQYYSRIGGV